MNQARQLDRRDFKSVFAEMHLEKLSSGSFSAELSIPGPFQEFCEDKNRKLQQACKQRWPQHECCNVARF